MVAIRARRPIFIKLPGARRRRGRRRTATATSLAGTPTAPTSASTITRGSHRRDLGAVWRGATARGRRCWGRNWSPHQSVTRARRRGREPNGADVAPVARPTTLEALSAGATRCRAMPGREAIEALPPEVHRNAPMKTPLKPRELLASAPAHHGTLAVRPRTGRPPWGKGIPQANHQARGRTDGARRNRGRSLRHRRGCLRRRDTYQEDFLEGGPGIAAAGLAGRRGIAGPP
ncbi:hypothetical protein PVAP13_5KG349314 [Panicum virgatum]|uniref:Uncharacterized protein n=1 Tax=Panicum virgatum TaxID=38727 RepID=A0A8T0SFE1_PANVG|nr:hypothetical protein PVAP13_5KG349314 [Panicum virgatum]